MSEDYARLGLTGDSIELRVWDEMTDKEKAAAMAAERNKE